MLNFAKLTFIGLLSLTTVVMASGNKDGTSSESRFIRDDNCGGWQAKAQ